MVARGLQRHSFQGDRIFAERGDVIAHPHAIDWDTSWGHVISASVGGLAAWEHRFRRALASAAVFVVVLLGYVAFAAWRISNGESVRPLGPVTLVAAGPALGAGGYALRARKALRQARAAAGGPSEPMKMYVWWAAGGPEGPMAMAALFPRDAAPDAEATAQVPVVNVPPRLVTEDLVDVEVFGDPSDAPVSKFGDTHLWPAQASYT